MVDVRVSAPQKGFVLVVTLGIVAAITVVATFFGERVAEAVRLADRASRLCDGLVAMESGRAEIMFRLATEQRSRRGFGVEGASLTIIDGRYYRVGGQALVAVQDLSGLLNVNYPHVPILRRLLSIYGVPSEYHDRLVDTLRDYTDPDDFHRLNGAERDDYLRQGLPPPANDWLVTVEQLAGVAGWQEQPSLWRDPAFTSVVSSSSSALLNLNTAPAEVLAALPGATMEWASQVVTAREVAPLRLLAELGAVAEGLPQDLKETLAFFPGDGMRITIAHVDVPWAARHELTLTPTDPDSPWRVDVALSVPRSKNLPTNAPLLPPTQFSEDRAAPSALFAGQQP